MIIRIQNWFVSVEYAIGTDVKTQLMAKCGEATHTTLLKELPLLDILYDMIIVA